MLSFELVKELASRPDLAFFDFPEAAPICGRTDGAPERNDCRRPVAA